jgi:hypothetical protein
MFSLFEGDRGDLLLVALAILCILAGIWTMQRSRYVGRERE